MIRLWPDTLVGRTALVVLIGVAVSNVAGLVAYTGERLDVLASAQGRAVAERVAVAARLLDEAAFDQRRRAVRSLRGGGVRLFWSPRPSVEAGPGDWRTRLVRRALLSELGDEAGEKLRLTTWNTTSGEPFPGRPFPRRGFGHGPPPSRLPGSGIGHEILLGSIQLSDGSWLNFGVPFAVFQPFWTTRFFLIISATTIVALAASVWAVRRASKPLSMFAAAAERLGLDVNAPPLPIAGPREVRSASGAFNEMQRRLQHFVRDRTEMLAAISHDLRTPLTRMKLRAEFVDDASQQAKMLADLDEMEAMIAATLAFARDDVTHERPKRIDLAALLQSVCEDTGDAGGEITYEGPAHASFDGRPTALRRLFANLIDNALKYGGGARVSANDNGKTVSVVVDDDGPGLDEGDLDQVFEPFYRVEGSRSRETGGVGLGLAVVRTAARAHGGDVTLANRPEGGLRVTVTLPKAATAGNS